ncbi:uncharacterized protein LOC117642600 [Thrips palmi]|uniref:Uncharacterized protein LOC117642600 n=1 Tax=Thrips palmi TaxID=161013 RepID=A0A6P8YRT7_THRPL|nr:uncharacterized protein LOC117642600 [Thrips palmi]
MSLKLLWWRMLGAVDQAAGLLVTSFQKARLQDVESNTMKVGPGEAARLRTFRRLWMALRDILDEIGLKGGTSMLVLQAVEALSLLLYSVQTVLAIIKGFTWATLWMTILATVSLVSSSTLCDSGQKVADKMQMVAVLLESTPAANLSPAVEYELDVFRQNMVLKSAAIRLCGFVPLNRPFLGSVLVVLLTYLMVLLQFALL